MTTEDLRAAASALRERFARLRDRAAATPPGPESDAVKRELAELYRGASAVSTDLADLRGDIEEFVGLWRDRSGREGEATAVTDHLGATTYLERGWSRIAQGDYTGAEEALRRALSLEAGDPRGEALLAWSILRQGRLDEAERGLRALVARDPSNALAWMCLGQIALQEDALEDGTAHMNRAIGLKSDRVATLYASFYLGRWHARRGDYAAGIALLERSIALGPAMGEAHLELGRAQWVSGNPEGARAAWRRGAEQSALTQWGQRCAEALQRSHEDETFRFD